MTRHSKPVANTAKKADKNNGNNSKHVQNQARVERVVGRVEPSTSWQKNAKDEDEQPEEDDDDEEGGGGGWVEVRRGKNPRQGESLDKDKRQDRQYNYEQAKSTRHAGRPADYISRYPYK